MTREKEIYKVTLWGSAGNLALVAFKAVAGLLGHSPAMVADAVHSLSDFVTDVVVLVFVGMYAHVVMFLNIVLCLVGVGFGIAALIGRASTRFLGIFGIAGCVLDILIQIICMIVVAITSGISAVFHLLT